MSSLNAFKGGEFLIRPLLPEEIF
ncbi:MAG: hypothetical protein RLZZ402_188, partial [Bacteroidota bacterium]